MSRSEIAWIYWTGLTLVALIGGILLFARGEPEAPDCNSRDVKYTVLDLVQKNAGLAISSLGSHAKQARESAARRAASTGDSRSRRAGP